MKSKPEQHRLGYTHTHTTHSQHRLAASLARTWPKNKRNLLPIDPLIGPVNKNAACWPREIVNDLRRGLSGRGCGWGWCWPCRLNWAWLGRAWGRFRGRWTFCCCCLPHPVLACPSAPAAAKRFQIFFYFLLLPKHTHTHKLIARKSCAPSPLPLFTCFPLFASLGWPLRYSTVFTLNFVLITLCLLQLATCCACVPLEWVLPLPPTPNPPLLAPRSASLPLAYALDRKFVLCAAYTLPVCPALPLFFLPCPCCTVTPLAAL